MYEVLIGCSACEDSLEFVTETIEEAERLACECGAGYVIEAIAEVEAVSTSSSRARLRALAGGRAAEQPTSGRLRRAA